MTTLPTRLRRAPRCPHCRNPIRPRERRIGDAHAVCVEAAREYERKVAAGLAGDTGPIDPALLPREPEPGEEH